MTEQEIVDFLRKLGATEVRVSFGEDAYIEMIDLQHEPEGWDVWAYENISHPRTIAESLSLEHAVKFAKQRFSPNEGTET